MIDSGPVHADGRDDHEVTIIKCKPCERGDRSAHGEHEPAGPLTVVDEIIAFEAGELDEDAMVSLFQRLVDNGMAWTLQGFYGRTAARLIETGLVVRRRT